MESITLEIATDEQKVQIHRIVEDATRKAIKVLGLGKPNAQRVIVNGDELANTIIDKIRELSTTDQFKDEEVESNYGYLSGYQPGIQDLDRQIARLKDLFPGLSDANLEFLELVKSGKVELPPNTEKWGAVPNWKKCLDLFGPVYNDGVQKVLDKIRETRNGAFYNYRNGQIGPDRLRQSKHSVAFWDRLIEAQGNPDIIIVPFQFGLLYRGNSVRRAREKFLASEFGLGCFAIGCLILTHEERLRHFDDLWIDCSGDEYDDPDADGGFSDAPFFLWNGCKLGFGAVWFVDANAYCGSVSAFLPQ
jgi:hypothetical protein